jgi:hypothetical protein
MRVALAFGSVPLAAMRVAIAVWLVSWRAVPVMARRAGCVP